MIDLEKRVHNCEKCKKGKLRDVLPYPPVYSFGNPEGKELVIVGQNPSTREFVNGFLVDGSDVEKRRQSQLTYFDRRNYLFFNELERFFEGKVREKMHWVNSPWEKVGYLDIVKCPTRPLNGQGQWSKLPQKMQRIIISNCEDYLIEQLSLYKPRIIIAYGADVGRWFSKHFNVSYEEFEDVTAQLGSKRVDIIFIPQRQGPHSKPEVVWVQKKILKVLMQ
jgi:uracil-DNA glycosylase